MSLLAGVSDAYPYAPIQMHDSWLAVDPVIGCKAACSYCLLQLAGWTGVRPEVVRTVDEIVEDLLGHQYFVPNVTKLCFGTRTDVLLPEVQPYATEFLRALDRRKLRNPVALISKLEISAAMAEEIAALDSVRVVFLSSWSALPKGHEKGVPRGAALATMRRLSDLGVPTIHYFRPLVPANSTDDKLRAVLAAVSGRAGSTVHVGLKLNPKLNAFYTDDVVLAPALEQNQEYGTWVPEGAVARLRRIAEEEFPEHPLYEHTSCAMAHALGEPDYTATRFRPSVCWPSRCPEAQRTRCAARTTPHPAAVRAALDLAGVRGDAEERDGVLHLSERIGQEEYCHLLHVLGVPIVADVDFFRVFRGAVFDVLERSSDRSERAE